MKSSTRVHSTLTSLQVAMLHQHTSMQNANQRLSKKLLTEHAASAMCCSDVLWTRVVDTVAPLRTLQLCWTCADQNYLEIDIWTQKRFFPPQRYLRYWCTTTTIKYCPLFSYNVSAPNCHMCIPGLLPSSKLFVLVAKTESFVALATPCRLRSHLYVEYSPYGIQHPPQANTKK